MRERLRRYLAGMALMALLTMGSTALFMPPHVQAIPCGPGDDPCTAEESDGYDRFCLDIFRFVKYCFDVTYYHPPEPPPGCAEWAC